MDTSGANNFSIGGSNNQAPKQDKKVTIRWLVNEGLDNCGHAFSCACYAGACYYFVTGLWLGARGYRLKTAINHCRDRTLKFGGSVAIWSCTFNVAKGVIHYTRQKEDRWTWTAGGFFTGFITHVRASFYLGMVQGTQIAALFYFVGLLREKSEELVEKDKKKKIREH